MNGYLNKLVIVCGLLLLTALPAAASSGKSAASKPAAAAALQMLKDGNNRFVEGKSNHPHADAARLIMAGKENQGDYAYATVITCSDSRVPVERRSEEHTSELQSR